MDKRTRPLRRCLLAASALALVALAPVSPGLAGPPAALAPAADRAAEAFDRFAAGWMRSMRRAEAESRRHPELIGDRAVFTGYGDGFEVELRPTGHPGAPYVGILRYEERLYRCSDRAARQCGVSRRSPVTEIFRYQDGRWIY